MFELIKDYSAFHIIFIANLGTKSCLMKGSGRFVNLRPLVLHLDNSYMDTRSLSNVLM